VEARPGEALRRRTARPSLPISKRVGPPRAGMLAAGARRHPAIVRVPMILNRQRRVPVSLPHLQQFYERARRELGFAPESVTVQLVSDQIIARMNETFRRKRGPTDVLSFSANGARPTPGVEYVGDIAISPETARRNARRYSRSLAGELKVLLLHGMIHLAGYDHESDSGEMDRLERCLRKRLGITGR
jgi:probable rRNA maturation factor